MNDQDKKDPFDFSTLEKEKTSLSESEYKAWYELGVTLGEFSKAIQEMNSALYKGYESTQAFDHALTLAIKNFTRRERLAYWVYNKLYFLISWIRDKVKGADNDF